MTASVPPSSSIQDRAAKLRDDIEAFSFPTPSSNGKGRGRGEKKGEDEKPGVNIIAHSMGGLDARYMATHLPPRNINIKSVTTIATPHRGSHLADFLVTPSSAAGMLHLPKLYGLIGRVGLGTQAFGQLTRAHMIGDFNLSVPDMPDVRYFSYGASVTEEPKLLSPFRQPWRIIQDVEGPNDGLVSVESSRWGTYKGTLVGVSHLDLINWTNRVRWTVREMMGMRKPFNAIAFYLDIADMLAKEGL
jgi:triacylglycerol lipase